MQQIRWTRKVGWGLLALSLMVPAVSAVTVGSAAASTATYKDPRANDTTIDAKVRIQEVSASYSSTSHAIGLKLKVAHATDPATDAGWATGHQTFVGWAIFPDGSTSTTNLHEAVAVRSTTAGGLEGAVGTSDGTHFTITCLGTNDGVHASLDAKANTYAITFPATCVSSPAPTSIDVAGLIQYDPGGGVAPLQNLSPKSPPPCCHVTATPDPTTTTTASSTTTSKPTTTIPSTTTTVPIAVPPVIIRKQPKFTG